MTSSNDDTPAVVRSIDVEIHVPGSPEEVWQAIATGPGITAWFMPTEVDERKGGAITFHMGPGDDSSGVVTAWEPPRRFSYEEDWQPGAPPLATEVFVEARAGGTCVVKLVSSLFASREDWDDQLDSMKKGWGSFFRILRLYLTHFRGQVCSSLRATGTVPGPQPRAWGALTGALGLSDAAAGQRREVSAAGAPALAGVVEHVGEAEMILRTDQPAPGMAMLGVYDSGNGFRGVLYLYLFGDAGTAVIARDEPAWQSWMARQGEQASS